MFVNGGGVLASTLLFYNMSIAQETDFCSSEPTVVFDSHSSGVSLHSDPDLLASYTDEIIDVRSNLVIDDNTLFTNCVLIMSPGVSITVASGITLSFDQLSHLLSCRYMWKGIIVESNSALLDVSNTTIEDAEIAVLAKESSRVNMISCTLNRNAIGIANYVDTQGKGASFALTLEGTSIECTSDLNSPYVGQTANFYKRSYRGIWFRDCAQNIAGADDAQNTIDGCTVGIELDKGNLTVQGTLISNSKISNTIYTAIDAHGNAISPVEIQYAKGGNGIWAHNNGLLRVFEIRTNPPTHFSLN